MMNELLLAYAASSSDEVCGLIVNSSEFFKCDNCHPEPSKNFRISADDWSKAEQKGEITAVFHSHHGKIRSLSAADRTNQLLTGIEWWLACGGEVRVFKPIPHLLGRKFIHGVTDCYTLFRDAYHLCGINLPDFKRTHGWWLRGESLYLKSMGKHGFFQIEINEIIPGDVIIRKPFSGADPCHAMIYLKDNQVLHHDCSGHLSRREPYRQAFIKQTHSVWRHEKCSNLDLQGIYADISAKSI